jgi:hypothetical protein
MIAVLFSDRAIKTILLIFSGHHLLRLTKATRGRDQHQWLLNLPRDIETYKADYNNFE